MMETLPVQVVWPDTISGGAVETESGPIGLLTFTSRRDTLNIAVTPRQAREVAALWLNISDALDTMEP